MGTVIVSDVNGNPIDQTIFNGTFNEIAYGKNMCETDTTPMVSWGATTGLHGARDGYIGRLGSTGTIVKKVACLRL